MKYILEDGMSMRYKVECGRDMDFFPEQQEAVEAARYMCAMMQDDASVTEVFVYPSGEEESWDTVASFQFDFDTGEIAG